MRQPTQAKTNRGQVSRTASIPAPTGGWNTRDNVADMDAKDAVTMDNWFPIPSEVMLRKGSSNHVTGFTGPVESLLPYQSATASKLFACVDVGATAEIVDVTASDVDGTPPASAVTGLNNARFQHVNMSTTGGAFLLAVNGSDKMRIYNGTIWGYESDGTFTAVTGGDTTKWIHLNLHMRRVWAIQKDSLLAWYLPADSIGGAAASFDFRPIFKMGGYLMSMGTWTLDAGQGVDDHAVFVTSEGEVAVYKGSDPTSITTWSLVGVWYVGSPIGRRCLQKFGGDLLMLCKEGLLPFSKALMSSRVNAKSTLTDKIQPTISESTSIYSSFFGWEILPYPQENMLIINVPVVYNLPSPSITHQYAMNTISGAWSRFIGWNAHCWAEFNGAIYFGTDTSVVHAWTGTADLGANIESEVQQAFSYFGSRALKNWRMARPILRADIQPGLLLGFGVDYNMTDPVGSPTYASSTASLWDSGIWDSAIWGGDLTIFKDWQGIFGLGYCGSLHIKTASKSSNCTWASTDYLLEDGGVI